MSASTVTIGSPRRTSARALDHLTGRVLAGTALPALLLPVLLAVALLDRSRSSLATTLATRPKGGRVQDAGASVVEWVLVVAIVVGITVTVGLLIRTKITDKSNELDLTTP